MPFREIPEPDGTKRNSFEMNDLESNLATHTADLPPSSLAYGDIQNPSQLVRMPEQANLSRRGPSALYLDTGPKRRQSALRYFSTNDNPVSLPHPVGWVRYGMNQVSVIGKQQETTGILVQTPNGNKPPVPVFIWKAI